MTEKEDAGALTYGGYYGSDGKYPSEGREKGARRRKLAGYLRVANELRQSYQQAASSAWANGGSDGVGNDRNETGAYPDVSTVRAGNEEMVIFPSYARRHIKRQRFSSEENPEERRTLERGVASGQRPVVGETNLSRQDWNINEDDDDAIIDVDVRGCVYAPHRGPLTRKSRLLIGLARQLSGIPAPTVITQNGSEGYKSGDETVGRNRRTDSTLSPNEEELVSREAQSITNKGNLESRAGRRGDYTETPNSFQNGSSSPVLKSEMNPKPTDASSVSIKGSGIEQRSITKRSLWNQPADMSAAELLVANTNLMSRLKPFLNTPIANVPITIFFYNEKQSQSRTTFTNDAGHFWMRAALDFVPTDVRVIASENLSVSEKIQITEPKGISLISDIDDTIKHSAIGSGAREIFRNTFVRELTDLTIEGVRDWYKQLASMGVQLHYVSNSPWQLYPLLVKFFALEGLPPGSFHLKQYSGMLQGIFEPVAERKKGSLESIMRDFPERKFLLVGDSGEADLEVYTDVALANPGRVIGIYIRDVTTSKTQGFFDPSIGPQRAEQGSDPGTGREKEPSATLTEARESERPSLGSQYQATGPAVGTLIDLEDDKSPTDYSKTASTVVAPGHSNPKRLPLRPSRKSSIQAPAPPRKPISLRLSMTNENLTPNSKDQSNKTTSTVKIRPAIPPKPRRLSEDTLSSTKNTNAVTTTSQSSNNTPTSQATTTAQSGYGPAIRQRVSTVYNKLPSATNVLRNRIQAQTTQQQQPPSTSTSTSSTTTSKFPPPLPPPPSRPIRRAITSYPYASVANTTASTNTAVVGGPTDALNKKEELWNRRWARAKEILEKQGVELRSWRVGTDVLDHSTKLVERVLREMGIETVGNPRRRDEDNEVRWEK